MVLQYERCLKGSEIVMYQFTEKERMCLLQYVKDLIRIMDEEKISVICDNASSYTREEIIVLKEKLRD